MEIGGEFWYCGQNEKIDSSIYNRNHNDVYVLSGRTALDFIIKDIKEKNSNFSSVLIPSYCCESMIEPFERNGITVHFFRVYVEKNIKIEYDFENAYDAVLLLDFFGYELPMNAKIAEMESKKNKIIIYDSTHRLNGNIRVERYATYTFCSYRKWFYCNAAIIRKKGSFSIKLPDRYHDVYCNTRDNAALLKYDYMAGRDVDKQIFLNLFSVAEAILNTDYVEYKADPCAAARINSCNIKKIIRKRRQNASFLISHLRDLTNVRILFSNVKESDAPLFVPILLKPNRRDMLRDILTKEDIYCPIHWPTSKRHGIYKDIYNEELSLVCDQRYGLQEMARLADCVRSFDRKDI